MARLKQVSLNAKTPRVAGAPRIKQMRGAGENKGGYNPRPSMNPDPVSEKPMRVSAPSVDTKSYLPEQGFAKGGKVRAMSYGKGSKVISCSCGMK